MEVDKTDEASSFEDFQEARNVERSLVQPSPKQLPEEKSLIKNLGKLEANIKRQRELEDKIKEHPLDFMSVLIWEVELEKLGHQEDKLRKRNEKLWEAMVKKGYDKQVPSFSKSNVKTNPKMGYKPIDLSLLAKVNRATELHDIEQQLEDVYDRKNQLFLQIQDSSSGKASPELSNELDEVIRLEAKLLSKIEELQIDAKSEQIMNNLKMDVKISEMSLEERYNRILDFTEREGGRFISSEPEELFTIRKDEHGNDYPYKLLIPESIGNKRMQEFESVMHEYETSRDGMESDSDGLDVVHDISEEPDIDLDEFESLRDSWEDEYERD